MSLITPPPPPFGVPTHLLFYRPKDAVAAVRKRLTGSTKNFHIINLTLTVNPPFVYVYLIYNNVLYNAFHVGIGNMCEELWPSFSF